MSNVKKLLDYVRNEPCIVKYSEYCNWRDKCHHIANKLKIPIEFYPLINNNLIDGLKGMNKKLTNWEQDKPKAFKKYSNILEELAREIK